MNFTVMYRHLRIIKLGWIRVREECIAKLVKMKKAGEYIDPDLEVFVTWNDYIVQIVYDLLQTPNRQIFLRAILLRNSTSSLHHRASPAWQGTIHLRFLLLLERPAAHSFEDATFFLVVLFQPEPRRRLPSYRVSA